LGPLRRLYRWLVTPPPTLPLEQVRPFSAAAIAYPLSTLVHLVYVVFFVVERVPALVASNLLSMGIWVALTALIHEGKIRRSFEYGMAELAMNVALTVYCVGWGFGMQYFLMAAAIFTFLIPAPLASSVAICSTAALEYVGLDLWSAAHGPVRALPHGAVTCMNAFSELGTFLVASLVAGLFRSAVEQAERSLRAAHARTRELLNDVLPSAIADRLDVSRATIAESFPEASILFADIVGFTQLSQRIAPVRLVELLNGLFSSFDELVTARRLEKIKTIGDAYMVAAGIPVARADHAEALAGLALDMRGVLARFNQERQTDLQLRIGINSGPVVAGVIGKLRFLYDLWGDSVNTASRMESHGLSGEVQVSESTYERLQGQFELEARGTIEVKGKGPMRTWLLRGPRGSA
jgi:adenylate cyclase